MTPSLFACTCLLIACHIPRTLSTGELQFYRNGVPETSEDIALRDFARYLEDQSYQHRGLQRAHLSTLLANQPHKKHHLEMGRQKPRDVLETLNHKPSLADLLRMEKLEAWNYHRPMQYNDPINDAPPEREYDLPYYDLNPVGGAFEYPSLKLPYLAHKSRESVDFKGEGLGYQREAPMKESPYAMDFEKGMKEEPSLETHASYGGLGRSVPVEDDRKLEELASDKAEFTFRFDDANLNEENPFAVKPNDPRYYRDGPFSFDGGDKVHSEKDLKNDTKWERTKLPLEKEFVTRKYEERVESMNDVQEEEASMVTLPEPERRTGGNHPLVVPVNRDLNNDIYFIAIVAGCSAAAMFALVLISLTWCRLQRGVKAAADIEYPAYGVTGPNKDVSPSGDQRLAQSAQMYHFQHQKQQIIAMENRTSATRDPGSVSEAESDEENEEGDYTVYECPGLAPTGEMEVQNPLFHDDPTPATPAQTNKEEDHI